MSDYNKVASDKGTCVKSFRIIGCLEIYLQSFQILEVEDIGLKI